MSYECARDFSFLEPRIRQTRPPSSKLPHSVPNGFLGQWRINSKPQNANPIHHPFSAVSVKMHLVLIPGNPDIS